MFLTVASEYYRKRIGFDPLLDPSCVELKRDKGEQKNAYQQRKRQQMRAPLKRSADNLRETLNSVLTHKNKTAHANALVYMIQVMCKSTDLSFMEAWLKTCPRAIPTIPMLRRLGKIPDIAIKEFQSLFHLSEWSIIQGSLLYQTEDQLKLIVKKQVTLENLPMILKDLEERSQSVHKDVLSNTILQVKKDRLAKASSWKRNAKGIVQPLQTAKTKLGEENVRATFSPQRILATANVTGASEIDASVEYDNSSRSWFAKQNFVERVSDRCLQAVNEYLFYLNSH